MNSNLAHRVANQYSRSHLFQIVAALAWGSLIGILAAYGDTLPNDGQIDLRLVLYGYLNTATVWAGAAFFIGKQGNSVKFGAFLGLALLITAIVAYYGWGYLFGNRSWISPFYLLRAVGMWVVVGIVAGLIFGGGGAYYRVGKNENIRLMAFTVLPVLILSENLFYLQSRWPYLANGVTSVDILMGLVCVAALVMPILVLRNLRRAGVVILISILFSGAGILALTWLFNFKQSIAV